MLRIAAARVSTPTSFRPGKVAQVFLLALGQEGALETQFVAFFEADFGGADGPDFAGEAYFPEDQGVGGDRPVQEG